MPAHATTRLLAFVLIANLIVSPLAKAQQSTAVPPAAPPPSPQVDVQKSADSARPADVTAKQSAENAKAADDSANAAQASENAAAGSAGAAAKAADSAASAARIVTRSLARRSSSLPRPAPRTRQPPIDDYVPCLLDDEEIYRKRALETPSERQGRLDAEKKARQLQAESEPRPSVPFDDATAQTVSEREKQYLFDKAILPQPVTSKNDKHGQFYKAQNDLITRLDQRIDPSIFVGHTLADVPSIVSKATRDAIAPVSEQLAAMNQTNSPAKEALAGILTTVQTTADNQPDVTKAAVTPPAITEAPSPTLPPSDVACSFSVMQWQENSDNFGRRVANQYLAIQVTVRNLNQKNEFLLHDVQVAVDTGLSRSQFGRFEAARDKLVVRNVAQRGQTEDRRNRIINVLQAVGAVAGGASTAVTEGLAGQSEAQDMAAAVAIFQGPVITGVTNIFPDHTVEHLNHINDLGFSASSTSKTIVPIQGSVPLVTFISEKPLEQLPFSRCGTSAPGRLWYWPFSKSQFDSENPLNPGTSTYPFCRVDSYDAAGNAFERAGQAGDLPPAFYTKPYPFRDWSGAALDVLKRRIFVVVGGVHIQEVATQPKVANLDCPTLKSGPVDLSQAQSGTVSCKVSGSGLGLVSDINLQKADSKISGKIVPATDGNSATLQFKSDDLCSVEGAYSLFVTYKSDTQSNAAPLDTGDQVSLIKQPSISGTVDLNASTKTLTLNGKCMDQIKTVSLAKSATDTAPAQPTSTTPAAATFTAVFPVGAATVSNSYQVWYTIAAQTDTIKPPSLTVTAH